MLYYMDEQGIVYQGAQHNATGKGVEAHLETVDSVQTNALTSPHLRVEAQALDEAKAIRAHNKAQDEYEEAMKRKHYNQMRHQAEIDERNDEMFRNGRFQDEVKSKALDQRMGAADFEQLSIIDDRYQARQMAALQYHNQGLGMQIGSEEKDIPMMSTQVIREPLVIMDEYGVVVDPQYLNEYEMEQVKNQLLVQEQEKKHLLENGITSESEYREFQVKPENLDDDTLIKITSEIEKLEPVYEMVEEKSKKKNLALMAAIAVGAFLVMG